MPVLKIQHSFIDGIEGKICTKCHQWQPLTEFYKDKRHSDGLFSDCKTCKKKYREENRERNIEYQKNGNKHILIICKFVIKKFLRYNNSIKIRNRIA